MAEQNLRMRSFLTTDDTDFSDFDLMNQEIGFIPDL